jgi:hypothetical protein
VSVLETHCADFLFGPRLEYVHHVVVFAACLLVRERAELLRDSIVVPELCRSLALDDLFLLLHVDDGLVVCVKMVFLDCVAALAYAEHSVSIQVAQQSFFFDTRPELAFELVELLELSFDGAELASSVRRRPDFVVRLVYSWLLTAVLLDVLSCVVEYGSLCSVGSILKLVLLN